MLDGLYERSAVFRHLWGAVAQHTLSYFASLNSSFIACFNPLNPQLPFSASSAGTPRNSSMASSGLLAFICLAL